MNSTSIKDPKVKFIKNDKNLGINENFELLISRCKGKVIMLADQDDLWPKSRKEEMLSALSGEVLLVCGNMNLINTDGEVYQELLFPPLQSSDSNKTFKNLTKILFGRANYFGAAMCFKRELIEYIIPFPKFVESHDLWIALCANIIGKNKHINAIVLNRRIHCSNVSLKYRTFKQKILSRLIHVRAAIYFVIRISNKKI